MELVRRLFTSALGGLVLGAALASLLAPSCLIWYKPAPGTETATCNCVERTRETFSSLIGGQITGAIVGGAALLTLGVVLTVRGTRRRGTTAGGTSTSSASSPPSSTAPPTP
jgi:hypothetical protein